MNLRRCRAHLPQSPWLRVLALSVAREVRPQAVTPVGPDCLWCGEVLRRAEGHCFTCQRGIHYDCLASGLDPQGEQDPDPMVFCARCATEAYDELLAYRALDPAAPAIVVDRPLVWDDLSNQDVYTAYARPSFRQQENTWVLAGPFTPPLPQGSTPLSAARARRAQPEPPTPLGAPTAPQPPPRTEETPTAEVRSALLPATAPQEAAGPAQQQAQMAEIGRMANALPGEQAEQLLQLLQQMQQRVQRLEQTPASSAGAKATYQHLPQVDPTGADMGYKAGELGAPNHLQVAENVLYLGVGATTKAQRREMVSLIGVESIEEKRGCAYWPESAGARSQVEIGGQVVEVKKRGAGVPDRTTVQVYLGKLSARWTALRDCNRDVFGNSSPNQFYFKSSANLILARIEYLRETLHHLYDSGYSWPGIWRYLLLVWEGKMRTSGWAHDMPLDRQLLSAFHLPQNAQLAMAQLASSTVLTAELFRSEAAADAAAAAGGTGATESTPRSHLPQRAVTKAGEKCALCGSCEHSYRSPDYACSQPITTACPLMLSDAALCGLQHAHSGPRRTACRGGLEAQRTAARRAGAATAKAKGQ